MNLFLKHWQYKFSSCKNFLNVSVLGIKLETELGKRKRGGQDYIYAPKKLREEYNWHYTEFFTDRTLCIVCFPLLTIMGK